MYYIGIVAGDERDAILTLHKVIMAGVLNSQNSIKTDEIVALVNNQLPKTCRTT